MKTFLIAIIFLSFFSCGEREKTTPDEPQSRSGTNLNQDGGKSVAVTRVDPDERKKTLKVYLNKSRAVMTLVVDHHSKTHLWMEAFSDSKRNNYRIDIKTKIKKLIEFRERIKDIPVPDDEIGGFKKNHIKLIGLFIEKYLIWEKIIIEKDSAVVESLKKDLQKIHQQTIETAIYEDKLLNQFIDKYKNLKK
ncbi:hypothetical protein KKF97_01915 [Myxococcota bacterium]|nr:hypothetical protein [Myxococcota bacterium]MBU1383047.1 hypothetical protein [Myxococcota bacterium]